MSSGFWKRRAEKRRLKRANKVAEIIGANAWEYADDPEGLIIARAMSREERKKEWLVASNVEDDPSRNKRTRPRGTDIAWWYDENAVEDPEPTFFEDPSYVILKAVMKMASARIWDGAYLASIMLWILVLPAFLDGRLPESLVGPLIFYPLVACALLPLLPIAVAALYRVFFTKMLRKGGEAQARFFNVFFVLTLKVMANRIGVPEEFKVLMRDIKVGTLTALVENESVRTSAPPFTNGA